MYLDLRLFLNIFLLENKTISQCSLLVNDPDPSPQFQNISIFCVFKVWLTLTASCTSVTVQVSKADLWMPEALLENWTDANTLLTNTLCCLSSRPIRSRPSNYPTGSSQPDAHFRLQCPTPVPCDGQPNPQRQVGEGRAKRFERWHSHKPNGKRHFTHQRCEGIWQMLQTKMWIVCFD